LILEKEAAIKDVEYILNVISEYQKRVRTLCEEGSGITRLQVSSKIDNDVAVINRVCRGKRREDIHYMHKLITLL
jgi:ribosome-binding protein aMBF1 (putative translation factor)